MRIRLVPPTPADAARVMAYRQEFLDCGDSMDGTANLRAFDAFADWYAAVCDNRCEQTVRQGLVPATTLLAVNGRGELVGMIDIRHRLNAHLLQFGGHIGYSVRPSQRRRGYATQMLALALQECAQLGVERCLVTCDKGNAASARTILHNGGVLENEVPEDGGVTQRYWIDTPRA